MIPGFLVRAVGLFAIISSGYKLFWLQLENMATKHIFDNRYQSLQF